MLRNALCEHLPTRLKGHWHTLASNLYCNTLLKTPETFKPRLKSLKSFPYQKRTKNNQSKGSPFPTNWLYNVIYIYINYINYKPTYNWAPPCGRGQTPLFKAAFYGHVSVVEQLLKSGASVEARDSFGRGLSWSAQPPRNAELRKNQPDWGQIYIYILL